MSNWNKTIWEAKIAELPPAMTVSHIADKFDQNYANTWKWLKRFKYQFRDTRPENCRIIGRARRKLTKVDWYKTNRVIADEFNVSRQCVQQARDKAGKAKVNGRKK